MSRKWLGITALVACGISLFSLSCGDKQELTGITVSPSVENFGASNIPVPLDAGAQVQLRALGTYIHPPVTKDITDQVTWASNTPGMVTVDSSGLITATGLSCGGSLISATVQTNADSAGLSSSGAIVTGSMTANVVCFTGTSGGGTAPVLAVNFLGAGSGTVVSSPSGINCSNTQVGCAASFSAGTSVTLTATPVGTSTFGGWGDGCVNSATACTFTIQNDAAVTATFN